MRKWLQQLFTFTTGERNGILVLVFLCLVAIILPSVYFYFKPVEHFSNSLYDKEVNEFITEVNGKNAPEHDAAADTTSEVTARQVSSGSTKHQTLPLTKIDINTATAEDFEKLRGIGPVISKRIVKFRNLLGGYATVEQLKEVYGLPVETYLDIKPQLLISKQPVTHININTAGYKEFKAHPYFRDNGKLIETHRKQNGNFKQVSDLKNVTGIADSSYRKMAPYATVE